MIIRGPKKILQAKFSPSKDEPLGPRIPDKGRTGA
jgi:hypothetical protein